MLQHATTAAVVVAAVETAALVEAAAVSGVLTLERFDLVDSY